jgi:hypothetical protein
MHPLSSIKNQFALGAPPADPATAELPATRLPVEAELVDALLLEVEVVDVLLLGFIPCGALSRSPPPRLWPR